MKSIILSILFIVVGIVFCIVGTLFKSGKILDNQIGKVSGFFALAVGGLTVVSGIVIAIFPKLTDVFALLYVVLITLLLFIMMGLLNTKNKK
ncbi:MAG: hypothetical protein BKP49_04805 [Treponema sp. CETP13]|nr:MAG: hypothetical protein BKP49_04805 [Treponema sp. CETP13]